MSDSISQQLRTQRIRRIHFLGDSITQGCGFVSEQDTYIEYLRLGMQQIADQQTLRIYNHAVGGATAADGLGRIHWCERAGHLPQLSLIMFGLNDVHQNVAIGDYQNSLESMAGRLLDLKSEVIILSPTPYPSRASDVQAFADRSRQVADRCGTHFVDCLSPFYSTGQLLADTLWADGVHLTDLGHRILGQAIVNALLEETD